VAVASAVADYFPNRELLLRLCGRVPLVVAGNDPMWSECDRVISDHEAGTSMLTRWLLEQGKKRILRLWTVDGAGHYWLHARNRGFEKEMSAKGIEAMGPVLVGDVEHKDESDRARFDKNVRLVAGNLIEYLAGDRPRIDAIMATSDSDASLAAAACRLFGLRPNEDICIVGYDNFWPAAPERPFENYTPMATVDKQNHAVGLKMIDILQRRIAGELPAEPQCILVAPELVVPSPDRRVADWPQSIQ
jgi:DNA-binding LacI/PurR family transcriptional regulator